MDATFGDQLVQLWEEHKKRKPEPPFWQTDQAAFRIRLKDAAKELFGDLAPLLDWEIKPSSGGVLRAMAPIPGYRTRLHWSRDITGLYVFQAWTQDEDYGLHRDVIDGRLKLGAVLYEAEPIEEDE